jgi:hypothetical protein
VGVKAEEVIWAVGEGCGVAKKGKLKNRGMYFFVTLVYSRMEIHSATSFLNYTLCTYLLHTTFLLEINV